jgi:hypothetical protein
MLQGQSRLTGQTRAGSVTPAVVPPTIPIGVIDASKLPSILGKALPVGKLGTPVRVDEGRGDGSGNDNQSPANPGESTTPANGSGKVMQDANIHLMFWGEAWLSATNQPTAAAVATALTSLVNGPYLGELAQYGVEHAQIADANVVDFGGQTAAPANFTDTDTTNLIAALINAGLMPALTNATAYQELFALILPSGPGGAGGGWSFAGHHNFKTNAAGKNIYFLVVTSTGNALDAITAGFSHELVEACTDPDFNEIKFSGDGGENEIADVCENQFGRVNGVNVQKYWSHAESACVVPVLPNDPVPQGASRVVPITATLTIKTASGGNKTFNTDRTATLDNNATSAEVVISTPSVDGFSSDIVLNLSWHSDHSISVDFTSAFYQGLNSVTSYADSFSLQPGFVETYDVGHEFNNNADTCAIQFLVNN